MAKKISGHNKFSFGVPKNLITAKLSLLAVLVGILLLPQTAYLSAITPENLIEFTNSERQAAGLKLLTANQLLTQAANFKAKAIMETGIFKHTINDRRFSAWIRDAGYNYSYVGENLAIDFAAGETVIEAWKNSPLHKKNLLNPLYGEIGIAALPGKFQGQNTTIVVQIFGAPAVGFLAAWPAGPPGSPYLNSNLIPAPINLPDRQFNGAENLLTHSIVSQEIPPLGRDKLILNDYEYQSFELSKFIAQPDYLSLNNFMMIFASLIFLSWLIILYYYYFLKINRQVSV